jgi:hypothetical protein
MQARRRKAIQELRTAMKKQMSTCLVVSALVAAAPAAAQEATASNPVNMADMRHHIYVMEGALARAVDYGAKKLNQEILTVMPGVFMLSGEAQARGVYLDGYGVYFDVQVPMMRQSMMWSLRMMLDQDNSATQAAIGEIRKHTQSITDPASRASLDRALKQIEQQSSPTAIVPRSAGSDPVVMPGVMIPQNASGGVGAAAAAGMMTARAQAADKVWAQDPNRAYTEAVTRALVDAIIDYSTPMALGSDQWLTVAARDNEGRDTLAPQDPLEEVVTMIYRIQGSDLIAYRAGQIDRDEARRRVQVSQF